jgi:hypothetical protein
MKILDFGLAKQLQQPCHIESATLTQTVLAQTAPGFQRGTIAYMAPEQLEGKPADARTDIYALGLVLYEMAAGVHPFRGATLAATIANALATKAPPPSRHNSTLSSEFDHAVLKCLRKNPADRFQSSREILVDLRIITHDRNSAPAQADIASSKPGVARRISSLVVRHGWELLHVRLCIWCILLAYVAWRFRLATPGAVGLAMFFTALICTTALSVLLFTLLYTHFADKDRLAAEVRRMTPWFRVLSVAIGLVAWVMAVMVAANHTVLAVFLILMGTKFGVMVLTLKSTMDRRILSSKDLA